MDIIRILIDNSRNPPILEVWAFAITGGI